MLNISSIVGVNALLEKLEPELAAQITGALQGLASGVEQEINAALGAAEANLVKVLQTTRLAGTVTVIIPAISIKVDLALMPEGGN